MSATGFIRTGDFLGTYVRNRAGQNLGKIEDFVIDPQSGDIMYAVLSSGGLLRPASERLYAVPWRALRLMPSDRGVMLDAREDFFDTAPAFDREHWPDMQDPAFHRRTHDYYGIAPVAASNRYDRRYEGRREAVGYRGMSIIGTAFALVLLLALLGFTYMVMTRGWDRATADVMQSARGVVYAARETSEDAALTTKVKTALSLSRRVPASDIDVDSRDGQVTLRGTVASEEIRSAAEEVARETSGVKSVHNELVVRSGASQTGAAPATVTSSAAVATQAQTPAGDQALARQVLSSLSATQAIDVTGLRVESVNGTVTLSGTVSSDAERLLASKTAGEVPGVQRVINNLQVRENRLQ